MTKVLLLYDEISPASAKTFVSEITKLPPTAEITIAINSPGGSVPAGDAIAAAIDRHKGPTTARIDGVAASAASYVAMFCDRITMARGSFLMIHCPFVTMAGTADDLTSTAATLKRIEQRYAAAYSLRSGLPETAVLKLMKSETWFDAKQAVEAGFADSVDEKLAPAARVSAKVLQYKRIPAEVRAMAKSSSRTPKQRANLRKRLQLIAMAARFKGGDPRRDEEDRERGARMRKRYEMQAQVEAIKADDRKADAAERAVNKERLRQNYFFDWHKMPRGPR